MVLYNYGEVLMSVNIVNSFVDLLRNEANANFRTSTIKNLAALATLVAGVALIVFIGLNFLSLGVSMIVFSVAILAYQCSRSSMINRLYHQVVDGFVI